jgi:hypothetical protein
VFCGEHLFCARLPRSNIDGAAGSVEELTRIVAQIRARWPKTQIILRADSGFCGESLMRWCEDQGLFYVFGLARNTRLVRIVGQKMQKAKAAYRHTHRLPPGSGTFSTGPARAGHARAVSSAKPSICRKDRTRTSS